jgi:lipoprotein-anchoring transpeptidase ErfK/SrfK
VRESRRVEASMNGRHSARGIGRGTIILLVVVGMLVAGAVGTAFAAMSYDRSHADRILPGIRVDGIDVGGMTRAQAIAAVRPLADRELARTITVHAGSISWTKSLAQLGVSVDVTPVVDQALAVSERYPWWSRTYHRLANKPIDARFGYHLAYDSRPIETFVSTVARKVRTSGVDAGYALDGDTLDVTPSQAGHALKADAAAALLTAAVRTGAPSVRFAMASVPPDVTEDEVGKAILVNVSKNMLYLYDDLKVIRRYPVATAMRGFLTPDGTWDVINKVENPTWHNPDPTGWGKDEPLVIPPGPGNPLGTRALYLDAPGIRIHGTPSDSSIGSYASHGCIRMHIPDSEALYPLVPIGTPVYIVGAPPWGISSDAGPAG